MSGSPPKPPAALAAAAAVPPAPQPAAAAPACTGSTTQQQALQELSTAFGEVLSELQFSFVVSSARSPDLPIVYASPGFFSATGYAPSEVLGRNCRFLQGPATSKQAVMEIRDAIREERPCSMVLLNYRKDRSRFWNSFSLAPLRPPGGGPVEWFVGCQADVTRLVEGGGGAALEAANAVSAERAAGVAAQVAAGQAGQLTAADRLKCAVLECVPSSLLPSLSKVQECFVLSDPNLPDCPIVYASPSFLSMSGYACSEVVGRNCRFLQGPGTDPAAVARIRAALSADPPRAVTVVLLNYRKDSTPFWNALHLSPLRDADGKVQFFAGVQMEIRDAAAEEEGAAGAAAASTACTASGASAAAVPHADPMALLKQKGVVGSLRVATRALAQHGLRRSQEYQHAPCRKV